MESRRILPSIPENLLASSVTSSSLTLEWDEVVGAEEYVIYRDGSEVGTSTTNSFDDSGLSASTTYTYTVSSVGDSSNRTDTESAQSESLDVTTTA